MFRRQFESVTRRLGMDPATFATELEILAVRGFGEMGKRARDWMIRDKFIAAQRSCGIQRKLGFSGRWGMGTVSLLPWKSYPHW